MNRTIEAVYVFSHRPLVPTQIRNILNAAGVYGEAEMIRPGMLSHFLAGNRRCLVLIEGEIKSLWKELARAFATSPDSTFVLCCDGINPEIVHAAINSRLHGLISLQAPLEDAAQALVQICNGQRRMCFDTGSGARSSNSLTPSERKVLALAARGLRNGEIADALGISEASIKVHVHHLLRKTGAKNRQELAQAVEPQPAPAMAELEEEIEPAKPELANSFDATWMFGEADIQGRNLGGSLR